MDAVPSIQKSCRLFVAAAVLVGIASCSTPVKSKRQSAQRVEPRIPASVAPTREAAKTPSAEDSAQVPERRRILPLREQVDLVQQEQTLLHARIDSVRDQLQQLRSATHSDRAPVAVSGGPSPVVKGSEVRPTVPANIAKASTVVDDDDVIRPDEDGVIDLPAPVRKPRAARKSRPAPAKRALPSRESETEIITPQELPSKQKTSVPGGTEKKPKEPAGNEEAVSFTKAMDLFKRKQYQDCITMLSALNVNSASNEGIARNNYWIGECHFGLAHYDEAIRSFKKTLSFPSSDKGSAASYMIAESYVRMGKNTEAKKGYEKVVKSFPQSAEAVRALKRLQQI